MAFVRGTIVVATALWAAAEILKIARPRSMDVARRVWTLAAALSWLHAIAAFHHVYGWSQAVAIEATARQTATRPGSRGAAGCS